LGDNVENDNSKLKGVLWPGMSLFDSATAEMKRMRNQKKDGSILAQMKTTSNEVEPNEIIYNAEGEFQRIKDIYASSTDNSPVSWLSLHGRGSLTKDRLRAKNYHRQRDVVLERRRLHWAMLTSIFLPFRILASVDDADDQLPK
jgi:geranylgeranyl transferase type-2 subunit beta